MASTRIGRGCPLRAKRAELRLYRKERSLTLPEDMERALVRAAASAFLGLGLAICAAAPARAQTQAPDAGEKPSPITVSGTMALVSDYRFRGVSQTGGDPAAQASVTISHASGLYAGVWASTVDFKAFGPTTDKRYGSAEVDLYGGWTGEVRSGLTADVGLLYYVYPDGTGPNPEVFEPYASLSTTLGPAKVKLGGSYAWKQSSLGGMDNLYLYANLDVGIPTTPLTLSGHLGYTDGALAPAWQAGRPDRTGLDYALGVSAALHRNLSASVTYVATQGPDVDGMTDDAVVAGLTFSF